MTPQITLRISGRQITCEERHPCLLATLESHNIPIDYQCRQGFCGACRIRLLAGQVTWLAEPLALIQPGEILPCCCKAQGNVEIAL